MIHLVAAVGLEPTIPYGPEFLRLLRMPFRHAAIRCYLVRVQGFEP